MSADLNKHAQYAVEAGKKAGANDVWATAEQKRDVEFEYRDGKLEKVKDATSRSLAVKLYVGVQFNDRLLSQQFKTMDGGHFIPLTCVVISFMDGH